MKIIFWLCCFIFAGWTELALASEVTKKELLVSLLVEEAEDTAWNKLLDQGLHKAAMDFGLKTQINVAKTEAEQLQAFVASAQKTDLTIVASDHFHSILRNNAGNFRKHPFACLDVNIRAPNIMSVVFADEQAAFLAGSAAAMLTQTKKLGWLKSKDTPSLSSLYNAFNEGTQFVNAQIETLQSAFIQDLITANVDIVFLATDTDKSLVLKEAQKTGLILIGLDEDLSKVWNGQVLTSIIREADLAIYELLAQFAQGKFQGKTEVVYDLRKGVIITNPVQSLKRNDATIRHIAKRIEELRHEILDGNIKIKSLRRRPLCDCL